MKIYRVLISEIIKTHDKLKFEQDFTTSLNPKSNPNPNKYLHSKYQYAIYNTLNKYNYMGTKGHNDIK